MSDKNTFNRKWIIENSQKILGTYAEGITLRQLYYRLVSMGMTNNLLHYKRVVAAMTAARWKGIVDMDAFIDRERQMYGETEAKPRSLESEIESAKANIKAWMVAYSLDRWSNQPKYVEVWIEKKALQGVFEKPCSRNEVGLAPCKGYSSLTFLNEARFRFETAISRGQEVIILYFGDYDPSGEDIPRSIQDNLTRMGCDAMVKRIALKSELIEELGLPGVPPKSSDSRTLNWDGDKAVELDAVEPKMLQDICTAAIQEEFDDDLHIELMGKEEEERKKYRRELKKFVKNIKDDKK